MGVANLPSLSSLTTEIQKFLVELNSQAVPQDEFLPVKIFTDDIKALTGVLKSNGTTVSGGATINDLGTQTADYSANNKALKNLSNIVIGSNTVTSYSLEINNSVYSANLVGSDKSAVKVTGSYTADYFSTIDFYYNTSTSVPSGRFGYQFTSLGSFFVVSTSNNYSAGSTHFNFASGYFLTEATNGIKVAESLLFTTNNIGSIGTATIAPSNIYSVNAVTITSDNDFKKDIEKNIPLGLNFVKNVAKNAIATYKWKDTIIPEQKIHNFKKITLADKKTGEIKEEYQLEERIIQEEKTEIHTRKHFGFLGVELYNSIIESGLDTKDCAFLSIDDPNQKTKITINALTGEKTEEKVKDFEVKIKDGRPEGKITIKPTELIPILFKAIAELSEKIELLEKRGI